MTKVGERCKKEQNFCKWNEGEGRNPHDAGPYQFQPSSKRDKVFISCPWPSDVQRNRVVSCGALGALGLLIILAWMRWKAVCLSIMLALVAAVLSAAVLASDIQSLYNGSDYCQHSEWISHHWHYNFDTECTTGPFLGVVLWDAANTFLWLCCAVLLRQHEASADQQYAHVQAGSLASSSPGRQEM
jgi:hypothetical protein